MAFRRLASAIAILAFAVSYVTAQLASDRNLSSADPAPVSRTLAAHLDLAQDEIVIAGTPDRAGGLWVLAGSAVETSLVLYHFDPRGERERYPLAASSAGRLGGITLDAAGNVWVGAGEHVITFAPANATILRAITLPPAATAVATAQRAPDGGVLGLGQVTSLATAGDTVWVGRYAAPLVTAIDLAGVAMNMPLPTDTDVKQFTLANGFVWFTTNFGPNSQLGSTVGRLDPASGVVTTSPLIAASLAAGPDGLHAFARDERTLDPSSATIIATRGVPAGADVSAAAITAKGELVLRGGQQSTLHVYATNGSELRSIDYPTGSFIGQGGATFKSTPRLLFIFASGDSTLWFAPEASGSVYLAT